MYAMSLLQSLAFACHLFAIATILAFGLAYLFSRQFMPYHGVALGKEWSETPKEVQILVLALMRAVAGGALAVATLELFLLFIPFRAGAVWAYWAIPLAGMVLSAGSLYAMSTVSTNTPARPPFRPVLIGTAANMAGLCLTLL